MVGSRKSQGRSAQRNTAAEGPGPTVSPNAAQAPHKKTPRTPNAVHVDASNPPGDLSPGESGRPRHAASSSRMARVGRRGPWWRAVPGLPYLLLGVSLLGAFLLGARLGTIPMQQPGMEGSEQQQQHGSGSGGSSSEQELVTGPSGGPFPKGCKWREVYTKVRLRQPHHNPWAPPLSVLCTLHILLGPQGPGRLCCAANALRLQTTGAGELAYLPFKLSLAEEYVRLAVQGSEPKFWDNRQYEYWDAAAQQWSLEQPPACLVKGVRNPKSWNWRNGSPRSAADCKDYYCIYENLWYVLGNEVLTAGAPMQVLLATFGTAADVHAP
jgi:hypothetical protein